MSNNALLSTNTGGGGGDRLVDLTTAETSITGTTSLASTDFGKRFVCSGTSSDYTVSLPTSGGTNGKSHIAFVMDDALTKRVTLDAGSGGSINGQQTRIMWAQEVSELELVGNKTWRKIGGRSVPFYVEVNYPFDGDGRSGMSLTGSSFTKAAPNTVVSDPASLWDAGNSWITLPRPGRYQFDSLFRLEDNVASGSYGIGVNNALSDGPWFTWNATVAGLGSANRNGAANRRTINVSSGQYFLYYYIDGSTGGKTAQVQLIMQEVQLW